MIMLSDFGWIDGITSSSIVIFSLVFGIYILYIARKSNAKLLYYMGVFILSTGLMYLGVFSDFLAVLFTKNNLDNTNGMVGLLSYIWFLPLQVASSYLFGQVINPKKKWIVIFSQWILSTLFALAIFLDPLNSFNFVYPLNPGESLIDYNINFITPAGILSLVITIFYVGGFWFINLIYKGVQSKGVIRKKFFLVGASIFIYTTFGFLEDFTVPGIAIVIIRVGYMSGILLMYFGLREEPEKPQESIKKEVRVVGGIIRLTKQLEPSLQKPLKNTKKPKVSPFNIFISYSTQDTNYFHIPEIAKKLEEYPEINKVLYWVMDSNQNIIDYIERALNESKVFVSFCSENAIASKAVKGEWMAAYQLEQIGKLKIVPVHEMQRYIPSLLRPFLNVEFSSKNFEKFIKQLYHEIMRKIESY